MSNIRKKVVLLHPQNDASVAQLVEHLTLNQGVQGSTPCGSTIKILKAFEDFFSFVLQRVFYFRSFAKINTLLLYELRLLGHGYIARIQGLLVDTSALLQKNSASIGEAFKLFCYFCHRFVVSPADSIGNRVQIPDSSRCCVGQSLAIMSLKATSFREGGKDEASVRRPASSR